MELASIEELGKEATRFVSTLAPKKAGATLVTLQGELGAGKTAFTQAAAKALGVEEAVTSPTFVLEKVYELTGKPFARLVHIDAYRLEERAELAPLGFDAIMHNADTLVMLEWPEKVGIASADVRVSLKANADGSRTLTYA
jgi:tRNA threonylcarbamoyladenosine biosynthesis protein TsaE